MNWDSKNYMKRLRNNLLSCTNCQPGFTIVEISIGLLLVSIVAILMVSLFSTHFTLFSRQTTVINISSQNQIALKEITSQIRESVFVTEPVAQPSPSPSPTGMALDAVSSAASSGSTSTLTWSHTTSSGSNRLLVVGVTIKNRIGETVSGITYNGVPLTRIDAKINGTNVRIEMWQLVAPGTGTHDIVVTLSASAKVVGGATSWTGVNQTTPIGTFASASNIIGNPTVNVSSATNEIVLDTLGVDGTATATVGGGQTQHWNLTTSGLLSDVRGAGSSETGATTTTMSWTLGSSQPWAIGAVPIKPAPQPSPSPSPSPNPSYCAGDTSTSQVLVLFVWPLNANGEPFDPGTPISDYDCIVYKRESSASTITKKIVPSAVSSRTAKTKIIASNVSDLQFTYAPDTLTATEVTATVITKSTVDKKQITDTESAKSVLRNK